jgi:hypothetical protein
VKGEAGREITAAQGQALQTKYHVTNTFHTEADSKFRLYTQFDATVEQIISACPVLAEEMYIKIQCVLSCTVTCVRKQG